MASTITSFTNPLTLSIGDPTRHDDYNTLRTNEVYLDSNTTKGIRPATSTASTVTGSLVFSTQGMTITSSGNVFTFTVATAAGGIISLANTTTGSTITGSVILQNGSFMASTISGGNTFNLTNTGIQSVANTSSGSTITGSAIFQQGAKIGITISGQTFNFTSTAIPSFANTSSGSTISGSIIFQPGANIGITISGQTFNFTTTAAAGGGATATAFRAYATVDQVLALGVDTKLAHTLEVFDIGGMYGAASAAVNPPTTGIYLLGGAFKSSSTVPTMKLFRNGVLYVNLLLNNVQGSEGQINSKVIVQVTATSDYYELYGNLPGAGTVRNTITDSFFYGHRIGDI